MDDFNENNENINTPSHSEPSMPMPEDLSGMFRNWFLDYASYVILERAVPHIDDGLKPVQRRILHAMQTLDDGRFNKVANIVGTSMQYHPHGDASISDAIVQLGQKELLIDTQGNWGNILTGDGAAASRYIEARLSPFALETLFSPKLTEWMPSYDGRKKEPVTLPAKFPLLLAQGVEGIAVGLSSKILPHNFNELCDAAVSYLRGEEFHLMPDFQTGGLLDVSRYADGARGGSVKVRAKIEKFDSKTLVITEIPYSKTTTSLITSILTASEKGKIKIRKVDDNTSSTAHIVVHLAPGTSSDKAIDALYAFTDCEVSISPNCCVIMDRKPQFLTVSDLLRHSVDRAVDIMRRELELRLDELLEQQLFASIERIFISEGMYKHPQVETATEMETVIALLHTLFEPHKPHLLRELTDEDMLHLWEIRMKRILRFNVQKADEHIAALQSAIDEIRSDLSAMTQYAIRWFRHLKDTYGDTFPRRTTLRSFDSIEATKVAEANKRLYYNKTDGFLGTALKDSEFKCLCSDIDDILLINSDGTYKIVRTPEKLFVGKKIIHVAPFKKGDKRTIYNVVYRNGKGGNTYKKRFFITGLTRDKEYNITKGLPGSVIHYLSANPNGEAELLSIILKEPKGSIFNPANGLKADARKGLKKPKIEVNFADLDIKGKDSLGNLVTKHEVDDVKYVRALGSTLGGRDVWFDFDVLRINYDGRGILLGNFQGNDMVLVVMRNGEFFTTSYSDANHYDDGIAFIEKFDPCKVWTVALYDRAAGYSYLKRFVLEPAVKRQRFVARENEDKIFLITGTRHPVLEIEYGGHDRHRLPEKVDADAFVSVKGFKAKGKRLSQYKVRNVTETGARPDSPELSDEPTTNEIQTTLFPNQDQ